MRNVTKAVEAANLRKAFIGRGKGVRLNKFLHTTDKTVEISIIPIPEQDGIRNGMIAPKVGAKVFTSNGGFIKATAEDRITEDLICIGCEVDAVIDLKIDEIYKSSNRSYPVMAYRNRNNFYDYFNDEEIKSDVFLRPDGSLKRGVKKYVPFGSTFSQLRSWEIYMIDISKGVDYIASKLDENTFHAYKMLEGKVMADKDRVKTIGRLLGWLAPSTNIGMIETVGIYNGKFENEDGESSWDGAAFNYDEAFAKALSEKTGLTVERSAITGSGAQERNYAVTKVFAKNLSKTAISCILDRYEQVRFSWDEITTQVIDDMILGGKGEGPLANKFVIFGDAEIPDFITDRNGLKLDYDFRLKSPFKVLDIPKCSKAHTSTQMLNKIIHIDKERAFDLIKRLFLNEVKGDITKTLLDRKKRVPSFKDINSLWVTNVACSINPEFAVKKSLSMFRSLTKNMLQGAEWKINKVRYEIDGGNQRLLSDVAKLLGAKSNLLKMGEVYSKDAERYFKKLGLPEEEWIISIFKYPTMGLKEYYQARAISTSEMKRRIKALDTTKKIKAGLMDTYMPLDPAILIVPAIEKLKKLLAGMDFDFDGNTSVYDTEFNSIIEEDKEREIVNIIG